MDDDLNRRLLQNYKEFKKGYSRKKKIPDWDFFLPFWKVALWWWSYLLLLHIVSLCWAKHTTGNDEGDDKINEKKHIWYTNHVLHGHAKKFTSFLAFLERRKTSQPEDESELIIDDGIRKWRKDNKVSVGVTFSDYLPPCHPYEDNRPKKRGFEVNIIALMAHAFMSLLLMDHDYFSKLTHDLDLRLHPVER